MEQKKKISLYPRRLARKMAKAQLDRRGAAGYNKHGSKSSSTFANTWRDFAIEAMQPQKKGAKK